jgi:hypothetical protein
LNRRIGRLGFLALPGLVGCGIVLSQGRAQIQPSHLATGLGKEFASETATVNGITLHYVRGGKGPSVILIHGLPEDWFEYRAIMPQLAKRFTVIAVDLRGIGYGSSSPQGARFVFLENTSVVINNPEQIIAIL